MVINTSASRTSWEDHVWGNFKKLLTRTPVTRTLDNLTGSETFSEGTADSAYYGVFFRREDEWAQEHPGLMENADAVMLVKISQTINKDDKITFDSEDYRVTKVTTRYLGSTAFYKVARLVII